MNVNVKCHKTNLWRSPDDSSFNCLWTVLDKRQCQETVQQLPVINISVV